MAPWLGFLHTSFVLVEPLRILAQQNLPEVETFHMVDESLLQEILRAGGLTVGVTRRIGRHALNAEDAGASALILTCSSASPSVSVVQALLCIPFLAIDEAMAEEAVAKGERIGLLATVETTVGPTRGLLQAKAAAVGRRVEVVPEVCTEAFQALLGGDRSTHDDLVARRCRDLARRVELIVFAQGSMAPLARGLEPEIPVPLLTSLESGVRRAGEVLRGRQARG